MTPERYNALMEDEKSRLTLQEIAEGWRFCCEFAGLLINCLDHVDGRFCTCPEPDLRDAIAAVLEQQHNI